MSELPQTRAPRSSWGRVRLLDRNVRSLGLVSFFADFSTEMIYPLFPYFVTGVLGAPAAVLGLIEGIAEATASITRYPFGQWSDYTGRRRVFTSAGYGLAAVGKLVLAVAFVWPVALVGRFVDRLGKGMRTAPRDALIAASTRPDERGVAFGLHRTLDTLGAVIGPLIAILLLELHLSYRVIFAIAFVPGVVSIVVDRALRARAAAAGPVAPPSGSSCRRRPPSAGCWPARSSSASATPATPSSCSRPGPSASDRSPPSSSTSSTTSPTRPSRCRPATSPTASASCRSSSPATSSSPPSTPASRPPVRGRRSSSCSPRTASTSRPRRAPARRSSAG